MKKEDMVPGYYHYSWCGGRIVKIKNNFDDKNIEYLSLTSKDYSSVVGFSFNQGNIRLATQQEINHLQACIKAGKYVECPKEEIINSYELY